ncbi:histone-fold-containing protein [Stachybotrys elegans]|uniref:DNA polymerase epsilon subunit D n=1 Tax=Stachybotrys elegans TaxID=80388 RepID=A0A8K0T0B2_9HYPO|nr:histone-fold-containing protein [Stachybotrys elegans]
MPSRKSDQPRKSDAAEDVSTMSANQESTDAGPPAAAASAAAPPSGKESHKDKEPKDAVTIEDLTLPKSIITRLAKGMLPPNTQIQANAILALSKSTTVFINYLASHANEHTINANKKTIAAEHVFKALEDTEFGFLKERLEAEYEKFSAAQAEKRNTYRQKARVAKPAADGSDDADMTLADTTVASEDDGPRASKKARVDGSAAAAAPTDDTEDDPELENDGAREDEEEEDDEAPDEEEEEEEEEDEQASGDETQDALEDKRAREDGDEALDGDESD